MKGTASMLQGGDVPEPDRLQLFDMLQKGVSTLHEMLNDLMLNDLMLNDLMSLSRLEAGQEQLQVAPFDAAALLADFCTTSLPLADDRGLYLKHEGPALLPVKGDRTKIQRILQNLLLNALKYTRRGGVTVMRDEGGSSNTKNWMFCVQDTGPGIDAGPDVPLARQLYEATQIVHEVDSSADEDEITDYRGNAPPFLRNHRLLLPINCRARVLAFPLSNGCSN